jgi:protein-disulfide isomerase
LHGYSIISKAVDMRKAQLVWICGVGLVLGATGAHVLTHYLSYEHEWRVRRFLHLPLKAPPEIVLGNPQAPMRICYYYSLTCRYCRTFQRDILPKIQQKYLDTGRLCLVFCEFPDDKISLEGFTLLRGLPESAYCSALSTIFAHQEDWVLQPERLLRLFAPFGLSRPACQDLLKNNTLLKALLFRRFDAEERLDLSAVPSFVINGKVYEGALPLSQLEEMINAK